jgi:hypothetical protein
MEAMDMIVSGNAVLLLGVLSVFGAATHNHLRAHAAEVPAAAVTTEAVVVQTQVQVPPCYWTNPATSPLQGVGKGLDRPTAGPIPHLAPVEPISVRFEQVTALVDQSAQAPALVW